MQTHSRTHQVRYVRRDQSSDPRAAGAEPHARAADNGGEKLGRVDPDGSKSASYTQLTDHSKSSSYPLVSCNSMTGYFKVNFMP